VVTHAHSDHLVRGCGAYLAARDGESLIRARLGEPLSLQGLPYGEVVELYGVKVSLHPAGHILGSAQVRVESGGEVWVVTGDYKLHPDPTCAAFELVRCDTLVTESTFGLPIYRWPKPEEVFAEINAWWRANREAGRASLLYAYVLGKAQRILAGIDPESGPIFTHGAVERMNALYRASGVSLPPTRMATGASKTDLHGALVIAPVSARASPWLQRFGAHSSAFTSGWMRIRGTRRRRAVDRGFVLSDHADWPGLNHAIAASEASSVWVTHGYTNEMVRWLQDRGLEARAVPTRFEGEIEEPDL